MRGHHAPSTGRYAPEHGILQQLVMHGMPWLCLIQMCLVQIALARWAQQDDVVVGTATNGRNRPELQGIVGDLVNMVALRTRLQSEQTFLQVRLSLSFILQRSHP